MKNNLGIIIIIFIGLIIIGLVYLVFNFTQNTDAIISPEKPTQSTKISPSTNEKLQTSQINTDDGKAINSISTTNAKENASKELNDQNSSTDVNIKEIKQQNLPTPIPVKPVNEMAEDELAMQLQVKNKPEDVIEAVNQLASMKSISNKSIDQLKGFIGKKNADVDAYIIKALSKNAIERDDVLSDLLTILKTSSNRVVRRCAADAIGEFKNAKNILSDIKTIQDLEKDERVKLKLSQTIQTLSTSAQ